jgi:methyltransferase (TIGR00027 family)
VLSNGEPSQTALAAAAARAAHLIVDAEPLIFRDTLADTLLGERADELIGYHRLHGAHVVLVGARVAVSTRSRYTEHRLAAAVRAGVTQYVILGAGLDSFAYRMTAGQARASDQADGLRVFEVDHPATQRWKRDRLAAARVAIPPAVGYVPVDLEAGSPLEGLLGAWFDPARPALVSWLGATMYLTRDAIGQTLAALAGLAPGTEIIVDHMVPAELRDADGQTFIDLLTPEIAARGEPMLTFLGPRDMAALMNEHGLDVIEQVPQRDSVDPGLWDRADPLRPYDLSVLTRARPGRPGRPGRPPSPRRPGRTRAAGSPV